MTPIIVTSIITANRVDRPGRRRRYSLDPPPTTSVAEGEGEGLPPDFEANDEDGDGSQQKVDCSSPVKGRTDVVVGRWGLRSLLHYPMLRHEPGPD